MDDNTKNNDFDYVMDLIELGVIIGEIEKAYYYNDLINFITGEGSEGYYFKELKPLYDKYGYNLVNQVLISHYETKNKTEEKEIETN